MIHGNGRVKRLIAGGAVGLLGLAFAPSVASAAVSTTAFCASVPAGQSGFTDIAGAGVHTRNVECLKGSAITTGVTATTYEPGTLVTRGQMATFVANMVDKANELDSGSDTRVIPDLPTAAASADAFTDDETNIHENNINRLAQADIVQGTGGTNFSPGANVTRAQMASFIAEALEFIRGAALPEGSNAFTDDTGNVHEANINRLANADIVDGTSATTYNPNAFVSRAQMASFIIQALADLNADGFIGVLGGASNVTTTTRPEIRSAVLGATVTASDVTPTNPLGQRLTVTYDENIASVAGAGTFVYTQSNLFFACSATNGAISGASIVYNCPDVDTTAERATLTTVGVDEGAVTDFQGQTNPFGDAAIGTAAASTGGAGGVTNAPDLTTVDGFRQGAGANDTAVNFTFDENAFVQVAAGFHLINTQGDEIDCTGPAPASATPSGGTIVGGNGTTILTVICPSLGANSPLPAASIARGYVDQDAVGDATGGGNTNVLQAADATGGSGGNSDEPDLVSATFQPDATVGPTNTAVDAVVYQFENNITTTGTGAEFFVYNAAGVETPGSIAGVPNAGNTGPVISGQQVRVIFPNGTLGDAVGASVEDAAATSAAGANEEDEVPVTNNFATSLVPGQHSGPQLTGVSLNSVASAFPGDPASFQAAYTFDEPVTVIDQTEYFLYLAAGQRLDSTTCTIGTGSATNVVTCTAYNLTGTATAATSAQIGSAVLAAVDDAGASATGAGGGADVSREDAQATTGGTGTPAS